MSATEKLIELYKKDPLLSKFTLTDKNIKNANYNYFDTISDYLKEYFSIL